MTWEDIRYFRPAEFDCITHEGTGECFMQLKFVRLLDEVRHMCGFAITVSSGYRTHEHNDTLANASPNSSHLYGWAADVVCTNSHQRFAIVSAALDVGINRVGIGSDFVHLDADPEKVARLCWVY